MQGVPSHMHVAGLTTHSPAGLDDWRVPHDGSVQDVGWAGAACTRPYQTESWCFVITSISILLVCSDVGLSERDVTARLTGVLVPLAVPNYVNPRPMRILNVYREHVTVPAGTSSVPSVTI